MEVGPPHGGGVKTCLPTHRKPEMWVQFLDLEDTEKEMATCSGILASRIPMDRGAWWAAVHGVANLPDGHASLSRIW